MISQELIDNLHNQNQAISDTVKNQFSVLTASQLNWKPTENKWSILQCLEHIYLSGIYYVETIEKRLSVLEPDMKHAGKIFKPGLIGDFFTKGMKPEEERIKYKMKTFKRMEPSTGNLDPDKIIGEFTNFQTRLQNILLKVNQYDLGEIKINSSIGSLIRFKLGDAIRFVLAHNLRHLLQAQNVLAHPLFPK